MSSGKKVLCDPIVMGHNQFFGVDHLSAQRGIEKAAFFSDPNRILDMVRVAHKYGAGGIMMSTHERAAPVAEAMKKDPVLGQDFRLYPLLPYAQKYVTAANEKGMLNVVMDMLSGTSLSDKFSMFWKGGKGILSKDINSILSALIQMELKPFKGLDVRAVFLHDVFTDLALALDLKDIFEFYIEVMEKEFSTQGAFATKNLPRLVEKFKEWNLPAPVVMTHVNATGFHVNPSREACEKCLKENDVSVMVMGSLASGHIPADDAYRYLSTLPNLDSIVVGASTEEHIRETFQAMKKHMVVKAPLTTGATAAGAPSPSAILGNNAQYL